MNKKNKLHKSNFITINNKMDKMIVACKTGNLIEVKKLIEDGDDINCRYEHNHTALHLATIFGHIDIVQYLVSEGADINSIDDSNHTPIIIAILVDDPEEIIKYLLLKGSTLNWNKWLTDERDHFKYSAEYRSITAKCHTLNPYI